MNYHSIRRVVRHVCPMLALVILCGCAALTVDVDVYKGPLVNDAHVQIEQVASQAMGAKPLLIQLRDRLELDEPDRLRWQLGKETNITLPDKTIVRREPYRAGFIPSSNGKITLLQSEQAKQVNGVLSLYEDVASALPEDIRKKFDQLMHELARYAYYEKIVNPPAEVLEKQRKQWEQILSKTRISGGKRAILEAYKEYASPAYAKYQIRETGGVVNAVDAYLQQAGRNAMPAAPRVAKELAREARIEKPQGRATRFSELHKNRDRVAEIANWIFAQDRSSTELARKFVDLVSEPANAFIECRDALDISLIVALDLLETVPTDYRISEALKTRAVEALSSVAAQVVSKSAIGQAREALDTRGNDRTAQQAVQTASKIDVPPEQRAALLVKRPVAAAQEWKALHDAAIDAGQPFGISSGPLVKSNDRQGGMQDASESAIDTQKLLSVLDTVASAAGLERGRPPEGLETLIEQYSSARMNVPYLDESEYSESQRVLYQRMQEKRDRLFVALVHFAQKIQVIANYSQLIDHERSSGTNRQALLERQQALQVVATALLSQIDDLRKYNVAYRTSVASAHGEADIVHSVWNRDSRTIAVQLLTSLESRRNERSDAETAIKAKHQALELAVSVLGGAAACSGDRARLTCLELLLKKCRADDRSWLNTSNLVADTTIVSLESLRTKLLEAIAVVKDNEQAEEEARDQAVACHAAILSAKIDNADVAAALLDDLSKHVAEVASASDNESVQSTLSAYRNELLAAFHSRLDRAAVGANPVTPITQACIDFVDYLTLRRDEAKSEMDKASGDAVRLASSLTIALAQLPTFLADLDIGQHSDANAADAFAAYLSGLATERASDADRQKISEAADDLRDLRGLAISLQSSDADSEKDPSEVRSIAVVDRVIALLEHERARALVAQDVKAAQGLDQAAAAMKQRRADLLHIKPSSVFLRNSYPVTAFQQVPPLARRSILWSDTDKLDESLLRVASDIDKQFWQSINHVYVKGGVTSNYAIIRDDVGNFVVKQFSSNPAKLIQTGTKLAQFTMANPASVPLVTNMSRTVDGAPTGASAPELGPVGRQLAAHDVQTLRSSLEAYHSLGKIAASAQTALQKISAEDAELKAIKADVDAQFSRDAVRQLIARADSMDIEQLVKGTQSQSGAPLQDYDPTAALSLVHSVHDQLQSVATATYFSAASDEPKLLTARDALYDAIGKPLAGYIARRRDALDASSASLRLIGAAGEPAAK